MTTLSTYMIFMLLIVTILAASVVSTFLLVLKTVYKKKVAVDLGSIKKAFIVMMIFFVLLVGLFQSVAVLDTWFIFGSLRNCTTLAVFDRSYSYEDKRWNTRHISINDSMKIRQVTNLIVEKKYKLTSIGFPEPRELVVILVGSNFSKRRPTFQFSVYNNSISFNDNVIDIPRKYECSDGDIRSDIQQVLWANGKE